MIFFKSRNKIILIGVLDIFVQHYVVKELYNQFVHPPCTCSMYKNKF
nr:MAG TPA: hypothetical protein [Caudoviricetes sp.]